MGFAFFVAKLSLGKETAFAVTADSAVQTGQAGPPPQKGATIKLCQDKEGQSFKILASQKSLSDILSL